jgi:hypothetical protein
MATNSIAEPFASRPPRPSSLALGEGAIVCLARQTAKRAVQEQLHTQGLRPTRMKASENEAPVYAPWRARQLRSELIDWPAP